MLEILILKNDYKPVRNKTIIGLKSILNEYMERMETS